MGPDLNIVSETAENKPDLCFKSVAQHILLNKEGRLVISIAPGLYISTSPAWTHGACGCLFALVAFIGHFGNGPLFEQFRNVGWRRLLNNLLPALCL